MVSSDELAQTWPMNPPQPARSKRGLKGLLARWRSRRRPEQPPDGPPPSPEAMSVVIKRNPQMDDVRGAPAETVALIAGMYVTDGCSLLRIEHVHTDTASGTTFVELEDCTTMELSVCTAESLASRPLRGVVPGAAPPLSGVAQARAQDSRARGGRAAA
jgi:hypothetical protein